MHGQARSEVIVPNSEHVFAHVTCNDATANRTFDLTNYPNANTAMLYSDKAFCVSTEADPDPAEAVPVPASTIYYHPVNGATTLFVHQATAGDTCHVRCQLFSSVSSPSK